MDKYLIKKPCTQDLSPVQNSSSSIKQIRVDFKLEILKEHPEKKSWSRHCLNIRDSLEFLYRNSIKNSIHGFAIKSGYFFLRSLPLTNWSSGLLPSVFNGIPDSLINKFQEWFHLYFPVGIVIPIKVRWNNKRVTIFHDNRGQGSTLRSKDLNTRANPL